MWIASVANIGWPSRPGLSTETVQAEYRACWISPSATTTTRLRRRSLHSASPRPTHGAPTVPAATPPLITDATRDARTGAVTLAWVPSNQNPPFGTATSYAIYRFDGPALSDPCRFGLTSPTCWPPNEPHMGCNRPI